MMMYHEAEHLIRRELGPGERLLWSGQPRRGIRLQPADAVFISFTLLWSGFAIVWEYQAIEGAGLFFALAGVPFILIGVYMIVGRFFADARRRAKTAYALTDQRVLIVSDFFGRRLTSLPLATSIELSVTERADRSGTTTFGRAQPMQSWTASIPWPGTNVYAAPSFEQIEEVRQVYDLVSNAQRAVQEKRANAA